MSNDIGRDGQIKINGNAVAELRNFKQDESADTVDDTVMGDVAKTHKFTQSEWTATAEALWDKNDTLGQGACTIGASVTVALYPIGSGAGAKYATGTATITARGLATEHTGLVQRTLTFKGNGALSEATVGA